jgi:AraC-like DNA-binding protein
MKEIISDWGVGKSYLLNIFNSLQSAYDQGVALMGNSIRLDNSHIKGVLEFFPLDNKIAVSRLTISCTETITFRRPLLSTPEFYACIFSLKDGMDLHAFDSEGEEEMKSFGLTAKHSALYFSSDVQTRYRIRPNEQTQTIFIVFSHDALDAILYRKDKLKSDIFLGESVKGYASMNAAMIDKVTQIFNYKGTTEMSELYLLGAAYELLAMLFQEIVTEQKLLTQLTGMAEVARMVQIRNFMVSDFSNNCPLLEEMAKRAQMSVTKFKTFFKSLFKLPYYQYYQRYRLQAARQNIIYGKSVSETAYEFGFSSVSNFSVAFKKMFNMSPSEIESHSDNVTDSLNYSI